MMDEITTWGTFDWWYHLDVRKCTVFMVDLWEKVMLVITVQNMSNMADVSDYHFEVWVTTKEGKKKFLEVGDISQHKRSDGWKLLVQRVLDLCKEE